MSLSEKKRKNEGEVYSIFKKRKPDGSREDSNPPLDDESAKAKLLAFKSLLDFSLVDTEAEISSRFDRISKDLLHEFRLVVRRENAPDMELEILEAEFYLQIAEIHEDPFTHGSEEQRVSGRWYFHRAPQYSHDSTRSSTSLTSYRTGSRKGMDLTFGGPPQLPSSGASTVAPKASDRLLRGGILLRSVRQVKSGKVTSGPSLLVDLVLSASSASGIEELVEKKWLNNTTAFPAEVDAKQTISLSLKPISTASKTLPTVYRSPRIGLDLSHPGTTSVTALPLHPRIQFLPRKYRFFTHPELLVANGRPQTFLGVLQTLAVVLPAGLKTPSLGSNIARITKTKDATAAKYLADYVAGRDGGPSLVDQFIGTKGKGASSSPATYLRMLGALSNID
ncbi:hypothetical protein BDN70DRAFT_861153 [Pholiota conissans]|uniref:Uncharacterized protein n=1 Tax=Pholiota conissans TaxID=109636 RepID=A0A9P5YY13_9AGAR|nr:hypothetical protein BDN70DRAFT_861153 [Pholiota conissans]